MPKVSIVVGVLVLVTCAGSAPSLGSLPQAHPAVLHPFYTRGATVDLPTWYQGDEWIYTIDPLYFSSPNASFTGSIQNLKEHVVGIVGDAYMVEITGALSGSLVFNDIPGEVSGEISGTSYMRISDLAQETSEIHSQGTITIVIFQVPYTLDLLTNSSPALEVFDFPLIIGDQWRIRSLETTQGSFSIQGYYQQSLNGSMAIDENVSCIGEESISVPAGVFDCLTLSRETATVWYSSQAGNIVKTTIDQSGENVTVQMTQSLQSFSRAPQPLTVTETLTLLMAAPGATMMVSGVVTNTGSGAPVQNGPVSVTIPCAGESWSTTTDATGHYTVSFSAPLILDDTPSSSPRETGSGGVIVSCSSGGLSGYRVQTLTTVTDTAPLPPEIGGSTEGKVGTPIPYGFTFHDPEGDNLSYYINWGDGVNTSWVGPGDIQGVVVDHTYTKKGMYTITAQTKDVYGLESPVGTLTVTMPVKQAHPFLQWLFERFPHAFPILRHLLGY